MIKTSKAFMDQNFLLQNEQAQVLYENFAASLPILDYHNHLSPKDIAQNRKFNNLTEIWLEGDHYKWRAMRINGISEKYITGDASAEEKFQKWAETVPYTMRNPLYHWVHLELKNYFGVDERLDATTASAIYKHCSQLLQTKEFHARGLLKMMNVEVVCTTDDPADTLEYHQQLVTETESFKMYPTFRPDKAFAVADPKLYREYLEKLGGVAGITIQSFDDLLKALHTRIDFFNSVGCRASDHGLENLFYDENYAAIAPSLFSKIFEGKVLTLTEQNQFACGVLIHLCRMYHEIGWVQQFHLGAIRNNNTRLLRQLGTDTGFDSIGDFSQARALSRFFDELDNSDQLAKTILYNNNPADNELFATMVGNFNDGTSPGKMQYGSGWWFLDQKDGMEKQMNALSNMGLLSRFVGMVTDSRSLLSFPRHEYFRRILCNLWGTDIERGELPDDLDQIGKLIEDIGYYNAKNYFRF